MKYNGILLLAVPLASAYAPLYRGSTRRPPFVLASVLKKKKDASFGGGDFMDEDLDRASDCAQHFGKCSVEEIESLKQGLHNEIVEGTIFRTVDASAEEVFEHRALEEDLALQLSLLKEEMPTSTMFHDDSYQTTTLSPPQSEVNSIAAQAQKDDSRIVGGGELKYSTPEPSAQHFAEEGMHLMEERGVHDAAAVCGAIVGAVALNLASQMLITN